MNWCVPCALKEPRRETLATTVVDGDPMCRACAALADEDAPVTALPKPSRVALRASSAKPPIPPSCKKGCGEPSHRGRTCAQALAKKHKSESAAEAFAPAVEALGRATDDLSIPPTCTVTYEQDIPIAGSSPWAGGRTFSKVPMDQVPQATNVRSKSSPLWPLYEAVMALAGDGKHAIKAPVKDAKDGHQIRNSLRTWIERLHPNRQLRLKRDDETSQMYLWWVPKEDA